jgi:hypothetical protein
MTLKRCSGINQQLPILKVTDTYIFRHFLEGKDACNSLALMSIECNANMELLQLKYFISWLSTNDSNQPQEWEQLIHWNFTSLGLV